MGTREHLGNDVFDIGFNGNIVGATFPLDIVSNGIFYLLQFTPFPYLVYFPVAIWIGKVETVFALKILLQALIWLGISYYCVIKVWQKD